MELNCSLKGVVWFDMIVLVNGPKINAI